MDETREPERPGTWANPETFIPVVLRSYRRDRWELQPHRVEVWSEKGTVRGTLAPVLARYGITFRVMHGHGSATALHEAAEESQADGTPADHPLLWQLGSQWHAYEPDRHPRTLSPLQRSGGGDPGRVGRRRGRRPPETLPSFSAADKESDSRYQWFVQQYGDTCWELDALSPTLLRERVAAAIGHYIDWDAWLRCDAVEEAERRSLRQVLSTWPTAISGQATI